MDSLFQNLKGTEVKQEKQEIIEEIHEDFL